MSVQPANLENVIAVYYQGTSADVAAQHLHKRMQKGRHKELARLLRHYDEEAITDPEEIRLRAAVDDLLNFCNVVEITSLTGFTALRTTKAPFWDVIREILEDGNMRRYYVEYYPLKLPQLLLLRLRERHTRIEEDPIRLTSLVIQFLSLDQRFTATLNNGHLLRLLDSFCIDDYWFSDVIKVIADPKEFVHRILLPPEKRGVIDEALHELGFFMQFSSDLKRLLDLLDRHALVQSEVWNHYGYWFGIIGEHLNEQLGQALDQFLYWAPTGSDKRTVLAIQESVDEARRVLADLTSGRYEAMTDRAIKEGGFSSEPAHREGP